MPMPSTAIQRRADVPPHSGSREPARRIASQGRPYADRPAPAPVALASAHGSAVIVDMAVLQERARIARELHDSVAQTLYAIGLVAGRALDVPDLRDPEHVERLFDHVLQLASHAQGELRALLTDLWADEPRPGGLTQALNALAADHESRHQVQVRLALSAEPDDVPAEISEALVRIAREALSNVARHARARHVDVELDVGALDLTLRIIDDGRGFDPALPTPGHFGLRSIRERAHAVGGTVQVTSAEGHGTCIRVRIPREGGA